MHISDVDVPRRRVEGFPQLSVIEPDFDQLAELGQRFDAGEDERMGENIAWLFKHFVRDADGNPIEGVETPERGRRGVRRSMVLACIDAMGPGGEALETAPQS